MVCYGYSYQHYELNAAFVDTISCYPTLEASKMLVHRLIKRFINSATIIALIKAIIHDNRVPAIIMHISNTNSSLSLHMSSRLFFQYPRTSFTSLETSLPASMVTSRTSSSRSSASPAGQEKSGCTDKQQL